MIYLACTLMALASVGSMQQTDKEKQLQGAKEKAEELGKAMVGENYSRVIDLTHPKLVERGGGREKIIEAVTAAMKAQRARGLVIQSVKYEAPVEIVPGGNDLYTIVPMTMTMTIPDGKATAKSYLIGISNDAGKTWTFVDGARADPKTIKTILPDFPDKLKLPDVQKPVIERKK